MATAQLTKWLILGTLAFHVLGFLAGCKPERDAEAAGNAATADSPGWERLRREQALPPEERNRIGPPKGPVSREW